MSLVTVLLANPSIGNANWLGNLNQEISVKQGETRGQGNLRDIRELKTLGGLIVLGRLETPIDLPHEFYGTEITSRIVEGDHRITALALNPVWSD